MPFSRYLSLACLALVCSAFPGLQWVREWGYLGLFLHAHWCKRRYGQCADVFLILSHFLNVSATLHVKASIHQLPGFTERFEKTTEIQVILKLQNHFLESVLSYSTLESKEEPLYLYHRILTMWELLFPDKSSFRPQNLLPRTKCSFRKGWGIILQSRLEGWCEADNEFHYGWGVGSAHTGSQLRPKWV